MSSFLRRVEVDVDDIVEHANLQVRTVSFDELLVKTIWPSTMCASQGSPLPRLHTAVSLSAEVFSKNLSTKIRCYAQHRSVILRASEYLPGSLKVTQGCPVS